jgi:dolichol-phosphate mannosyltransferase
MNNKIAIGVLAYNVDSYIENVIKEIIELEYKVYVLDDNSSDKTLEVLDKYKNHQNLNILTNNKNRGAGYSLRKIIKQVKNDGYEFLIKVDGDGQFVINDIKKIIELHKEDNYEFIKSNRFWKDGIKGSIPRKRFVGNIFATVLTQAVTGTNKIYDPLNGLFGISLKIEQYLDDKRYPKRYGYPYFFTLAAVHYDFKIYQINNTVIYDDQSSNLNSLKVLITLTKLSIRFYLLKIKKKRTIAQFQRSAFFDILFIGGLCLSLTLFIWLLFILFFSSTTIIQPGNLLLLNFISILITSLFFSASYKEEKNIRNKNISSDL